MEQFIYSEGAFHPSQSFDSKILQGTAPTLIVSISGVDIKLKDKNKLSCLTHDLLCHVNREYGTAFNNYTPPMAINTENDYVKAFSVQLFEDIQRL